MGSVVQAGDAPGWNDEHVADFQLDLGWANRHATAAAGAVRSAVRVVRAVPAIDERAVDEPDAAAGDDQIAFGLVVVRDRPAKCVPRGIGHLLSTRDGRRLRITAGRSASPA